MSTTPDTATVVDSFLTRFGVGDIPGLVDLFTESIDFAVNGAPNVPWSGPRSTSAELSEFFGLFGQLLTAPEEFTVHDGKITGYHMYEDSYAISTAFTP